MAAHESALRAAWAAHVATGHGAEPALLALLARHREPHRRYHGVAHLGWVVPLAAELADDECRDITVAAAFFHDAVYDPRSTANEAASARLAEQVLGELGWVPERTARVVAAIEATADHAPTGDPCTAALLDADLSILGADPARYAEYAAGVRAEYAHLDDDTWRAGRSAVLRSLLERPRLFATVAGAERFERTARANLTAELAALSAGG